MPSFINTNLASLNAQRNLNQSQGAQQTALQRLSSGLRINSAKDDAAGMSIASRMSSQINGTTQAARNANDGISLAQTAEGDLTQISTNLQRMRDLSVQSANATNSASDRAALNNEVQSLSQEINRVATNSSFNGVKLLDGSFTAQNFQIGANATVADSIQLAISGATALQLGGVGTTTAANVAGTQTTQAITAGAVTLNGIQVPASAAGALPGEGAGSATAIAKAINTTTGTSGVTATANATSSVGLSATAFAKVAAGSFSINGIAVGEVAAGADAIGQGANAAAAINLISGQSGVTAAANATNGALTLTAADGRNISISSNTQLIAGVVTPYTTLLADTGLDSTKTDTVSGSAAVATGAVAAAMTVNTVPITGAAGASGASAVTNAASFVTAFNNAATSGLAANATLVGITASSDANGVITLTSNGTQPSISIAAAGTANIAAATSTSQHGTVSLTSNNVNGLIISGGAVASAGLTSGTTSATTISSVTSISTINISTAAGATAALTTIDGAIAQVNASRSALGAYQNRFTSVVASLQTSTENLTASRSRIQDTDFAAETASLSRAQILQQAGTAMLAQANQLPNQVMTLLR
jgi:flagellin